MMPSLEEVQARVEAEAETRRQQHLDAFIAECGGLEPAIEMAIRQRDAADRAVATLEGMRV